MAKWWHIPKGRALCETFLEVAALSALLSHGAAAQSCTYLSNSGACGAPEQPQQCFADALAPTPWLDPGSRTTQWLIKLDSPESKCHPPVDIGRPPCCASNPLPLPAPMLTNLRAVLLRKDDNKTSTDLYEISVDYDAPNYLCQNTGDWPPAFTCTNDPLASSDRLILWRGPKSSRSDILSRTFIYFENATWRTKITLACGQSTTVTAEIDYLTTGGLVQALADLEIKAPKCTDKRPCAASAGGVAPSAGDPINTGSGDVSAFVPFFSLAQSPLGLGFGLSYHSEPPRYPGLVASPVALGWTHPYAEQLRPVDATASSLYHLTAQGLDSEYTKDTANTWTATSPGELRGHVVQVGAQYQLTDQDGTVTTFDVATGAWLATADRWGNTLQGLRDGSGNLASVSDSEGRQLHLSYSGSQLASITLPNGETWRFGYQNGELAQVFDPLHPGSAAWRNFTYAADSTGAQRLLTGEFDEAGALLVGHTYDSQDRGVASVAQGGRDQVAVLYDTPSPGQTQVTHTIDGVTNQISVFTLHYGKGRYLADEIFGNCPTCGGASSDDQHFIYFDDNHVASKTDGNGHVTQWTYNDAGNVVSLIEAMGTPQQRTTTYQYGYAPWPNFQTEIDLPSAAKPGATKTMTYTWNATGTPETVLASVDSGYLSATDLSATSYTTTRTFDARHRLLSTNGPRIDVAEIMTLAYYGDSDADPNRRGRLKSTTDAIGLTTTYDVFDEFGTARTVTDANGVVTALTTDGRGRVVSSTAKAVAGVSSEPSDYTTTLVYDGRDRLAATRLPAGNGIGYGYEDGTNRLLDTLRLDASGSQRERRHLTLNVFGDVVRQDDQSCDVPSSACTAWTTHRTESYTYDLHNRLQTTQHPIPAGSQVLYTYDADGLLSTLQDEDHATPNVANEYDALHRLVAVQQKLASAPGGVATTSYVYDVMNPDLLT